MERFFTIIAAILALQISSEGAWVNVTANLAGHACACGGVYCLATAPHKNQVVVGVCGNQGLFETTNGGTSWQPMGSSTNWVDPNDIAFDRDNPDVFWEIGMHGGGAHRTTDGGATFSTLGQGNGDGISIDMTDPLRRTIVIGAHEATHVAKSTDGGTNWTDITSGLSGVTSFPLVIDEDVFLVTAGAGGVYRTTNGGSVWTKVSSISSGWPLLASNGTIYVSSGNSSMIRSTDQGITRTSIPNAGGIAVELPDSSIAAVGTSTLMRSTDNGITWKSIGSSLPAPGGMSQGNFGYDGKEGAFFMIYWNCNTTVSSNSIWRQDFPITPTSANPSKRAASYSGIHKKVDFVEMGTHQNRAGGADLFDLYGRQIRSSSNAGTGFAVCRRR